MRIAICDQDSAARDWYARLLTDLARRHGMEVELAQYQNGNGVLFHVKDKRFADLLLLETWFPGPSGPEVARQARRMGYSGEIVFLTASRSVADILAGYDVDALHYIIKGETPTEKIEEILLRAREAEQKAEKKYVLFASASEWVNIAIRSIRYLEIYKKLCTVHYGDKRFVFYAPSLEVIEKQLEGMGFVRTHRSYLVALEEILSLSYTELATRGGKTLPVGRTYYQSIRQALEAFAQATGWQGEAAQAGGN
ncbi:MAG: LytTR family DNA-binding domain-containing protein [Desulfovibrionaceae bacterium]|nr:LytTR family DNA-binding domain-containing protein [Desulfovibrionaceae bacterium]